MSEPALRLLMLPRYGGKAASSRLRTLQYLPDLTAAGVRVSVYPLLDDALLQARYGTGHYHVVSLLHAYIRRIRILLTRRSYDLVWMEKESLPWWPLWLERLLLRGAGYVLDYDDAVFHTYDSHPQALVRRLLSGKLGGLMSEAALVVAGNAYLADYARAAGARRVEQLPTVIDLERYPAADDAGPTKTQGPLRIVWIGSPSTVKYLEDLQDGFQALAATEQFVLRVIGGGQLRMPGVMLECLDWSETTEVALLRDSDIGIMPLRDTAWEWGKCGYKLIQYMACGLPVVASAVGANRSIVDNGEQGFLVSDLAGWTARLTALLADGGLRARMGQAGRARVKKHYCRQATAPRLIKLLAQAARQNRMAT